MTHKIFHKKSVENRDIIFHILLMIIRLLFDNKTQKTHLLFFFCFFDTACIVPSEYE